MTQDEFNTKVVEGLELLQAWVDSKDFEELVLLGEPLTVSAEYSTQPVTWGNQLQLHVYRKMGLEVGLLEAVEEQADGFSVEFGDKYPVFVDKLTSAILEKCGTALRDQIHAVALAGGTQAQQLHGVRTHVAALLYQSRQHLAGAHAAPVQH